MSQMLDMRCIRYLNLFSKITNIRINSCFFYNNFLVFAVPSHLVSKAIGPEGSNVKKLSGLLGKKIKIVALPEKIEDAEKFIMEIVKPMQFKNLEKTEDEFIISANMQNKASLIGRNKTRLFELQKIVKDFFGRNLRII